jgi:hypothetical protein
MWRAHGRPVVGEKVSNSHQNRESSAQDEDVAKFEFIFTTPKTGGKKRMVEEALSRIWSS